MNQKQRTEQSQDITENTKRVKKPQQTQLQVYTHGQEVIHKINNFRSQT